MSRRSLHRPRLSRAAFCRPAPGTRLLPGSFPFPFPVLHPNTHNKRCPKAQRLRLRSDLSPPRPLQGRSPDKSRHALMEGCLVSAPLIGRNGFAPSGDAKEHGVMLLHRAIAPFLDSTVVTFGKLRSMNGGHGSPLPSLRVVEHFRWSRLPQSENFSRLVHTLSEVWGCDSTVVTIGKFRSTNGGHGSSLSSLGVVEHFRWKRLPQSESFSRLVHVPSEVWGCRRVDADVDRPQGRTPRIGTGVADILRKPSGTFHPLPRFAMSSRGPARDLKRPSQDMAFTADHPHPTSGSVRGAASRSLEKWAGMRLMPSPPTSTKLEGSTCPESLEGERGIKGERVPLWGWGYPLSVGATGGSPSPLRHAKSPENPLAVVQSNQPRVQSMFNQRSIKTPPTVEGEGRSLPPEKPPGEGSLLTPFDILTKHG